jgi:8-oxo-dGTP pyrophosphatase MutT (NUDIX family)
MTAALYMDRTGKMHQPQKGAVITGRTGVFAACVAKGQILLTWPVEGLAELPGGGIDEGEDIGTAVVREIYEETGVICPKLNPAQEYKQKVSYYSVDNDEYWDYEQTFWLLKDPALESLVFAGENEPEDAVKAKWVKLDDLKKLPLHAIHRQALKSFGLWSE